MNQWKLGTASLLFLMGAIPLWFFLILACSFKVGVPTTVLVLCRMTLALHLLFRKWRDGWAFSAFLSGIVAWSALLITAILAGAISLPFLP